MATITKKDLVLNISEKMNTNATMVQEVVQELFSEMNNQLGQGHRIELRDFGVFSFKKRAARVGHNPRTLEKVQVNAKVVVSFKMGKRMKESINTVLDSQGSEGQPSTLSTVPDSNPASPTNPMERTPNTFVNQTEAASEKAELGQGAPPTNPGSEINPASGAASGSSSPESY